MCNLFICYFIDAHVLSGRDDSQSLGSNMTFQLLKRNRFEVTPESVAFLGDAHLLVALRETCSLRVLDCETLTEFSYHMNEHQWDTHVSFNALYLSVSPDQKTFSVSTDNSLHLIFQLESNRRLRTLSSHTCGSYGKPKVVAACTRIRHQSTLFARVSSSPM